MPVIGTEYQYLDQSKLLYFNDESQMKCDMTVQTKVTLKSIKYVFSIEPNMKVAWF